MMHRTKSISRGLITVFLITCGCLEGALLAADELSKTPASTVAGAASEKNGAQITPGDEITSTRRGTPFPRDPAFERYCNVDDLVTAVKQLDSKAVTDFALQLLHGQSVLHRDHLGISTADVFELARSICVEMQDRDSLARLAKAARRLEDKELLRRIEESQHASLDAPSLEPSPTVDLLNTDHNQFAAMKAFSHGARIAKVLGDTEGAQRLAELVQSDPSLTEGHKQQLRSQFASATKRAATATKLADKLRAATRDTGMDGDWDTYYIAANGQQVHAMVHVDGNQGSYDTGDGHGGSLSFTNSAAPFGGGPTVVQGQWQYDDGEQGYFNWSCNGDSFTGTWVFQGSGGPARQWWGQRSGGSSGNGGTPDPGIDPTSDPTLQGGGNDLNDLIGASWQSDNGSSCTFDNSGNAQLTTTSGMIVLGRVRTDNNRQLTAFLKYANRTVPVSIRILGRNQIQIGSRVYRRRG